MNLPELEHLNDRAIVSELQKAILRATHAVSRDGALMSFAFIELAVKLSVALRMPDRTKLEHRDWLLDNVRLLHERAWDDPGVSTLFEFLQKGEA